MPYDAQPPTEHTTVSWSHLQQLRSRLSSRSAEQALSPVDVDALLSMNGFGLTWLSAATGGNAGDNLVRAFVATIAADRDGASRIQILGSVLRGERFRTSWLSTEKLRSRHRVVDVFDEVLQGGINSLTAGAVVEQLLKTITESAPTTTVDARGQALDCLLRHYDDLSSDVKRRIEHRVICVINEFRPSVEREAWRHLVYPHDTIDPHSITSPLQVLDHLWESALVKAAERAFVFTSRLAQTLGLLNEPTTEEVARAAQQMLSAQAELQSLYSGYLTCQELEDFIQARLPSCSAKLTDYIVNRHQELAGGLTIHESCRMLIASVENSSSDWRSRLAIAAFGRQVFGFGHAANMGLSARPFFIDHGYDLDGQPLDRPSYVFVPAGAIWGKGAGVDLSCGVAFGGGVDLSTNRGRDGAYIGGSWSATLYHGHSHVGGDKGSKGAESRKDIHWYGLTVEDGMRLPWGEYVEAEDHIAGDKIKGVRTYRVYPSR